VNSLHVLASILGLALLMVVHEAGHLFAARASGMKVLRFSIGFGPTLFRYQSKRSETIYQVALIPFLAYVQIAGMNPFEEIDPEDKSSYANASLFARIFAIIAGPLANYLFASVLFFLVFFIGGAQEPTTSVEVMDNGPAKAAKMLNGDKIVTVDGQRVKDWDGMRKLIVNKPNKPVAFGIERNGKPMELVITPKLERGEGLIGVKPVYRSVPIGAKEAGIRSLALPYEVVKSTVVGLVHIITGKVKPDLRGPVGIVKETSRAASQGWLEFVYFLGVLSAYLGGFNALPFPALDGGRLAFLGYEAVTRRKPNTRVEAYVHAFGLVLLLTLIAVVTFSDVRN
jgi:regulator of sigma E protease